MKSLLKYFKKSAVVAGCVFTALILLSCENFLDSGDVKKQLDELIEEANAKTFTIVVSQENTMGTFLSSGDKPCKIGKSIEVQFNLNKDAYIYNGLKAVSTSNREEDRSDCVQFTSLEKDYQQGVYKTSIKLVKEAGDILIVPDCTLVPGVITDQCEPKNQYSGCHQDTTVRIVFNKPVSETGFKEYINLSITDVNGQSLTSYYKTPYFTDNNTILNLPTNSEKRLVSANDSADTKEITITIDLSKVQDTEGNSGSGLFQYKYHVNKTLDDAAPYLDKDSVVVYSTSDTQSPFYKQLETNEWSSSWTKDDYEANHISDTIYIELEGSDADSGVGEILIYEKLIKKTDITDANANAVEYTLRCTPTDQADRYAFNYTIHEAYDGIIELEIFLRDNAGNPSTESKKIYVIKDTSIDDSKVSFKEEWKNRATLDNDVIWALSNVDANGVQTVKLHLYDYAKDIYYNSGNSNSSYSSFFDVDLFWGYSRDDIKTPVEKNEKENGYEYSFKRDAEKPVFLRVVAQDSVGNKTELIKTMDPRANLDGYDENEKKIRINNKEMTSYLMGKDNFNFYYMYSYCDYDNAEYCWTSTSAREDQWALFASVCAAYVNKGIEQPPVNQTIRVYVLTAMGDFSGPVSKNYLEFNASEWDMFMSPDPQTGVPIPVRAEDYPKSYNVEPSLKPAPATQTVSYESGPYIGQVISVESYKVPNSGLCKLKLDEFNVDYMAWWADIIAGTGSGNILDYLLNLNTDVQYTVKAVDTTDSSRYYTNTEPELYVTPGTYKLYVEATGPDGTIYKPYQDPNSSSSDHFSIKVYTSDGPTITTTDNYTAIIADFDAIAPTLTSPLTHYKDGSYTRTFDRANPFSTLDAYEIYAPTDDSGIKKTNGDCTIDYYLIPNLTEDVNTYAEYSLKNLQEDYKDLKKTFTYASDTAEGTSLYLPYGDLPEGVYNITLLVYDTQKNYTIKTYPFVNKLIGELKYNWNSSTKTLSLTTEDGRKEICKVKEGGWQTYQYPAKSCLIQKYDNSSKKWVYETFSSTVYGDYTHYEGDKINLCTLTCQREQYIRPNSDDKIEYKYTYSSIPNEWKKLCGYYGCEIYDGKGTKVDVIPQQDEGFYYYEYVYLGSSNTCTLKNCIQGFAGIQVYNDTDKTAFCHTMYSTEKITDTSSETNARIWETKGTETGVKIQSGNFTYGNDQLAGVPAGAWYTTIVHFADGTIAMSDIKRK